MILAVAGSAVGLGNFLRFPGQAAAHGGGAFMIPYLCALLLLGIPIGWAEWTMGRYGGQRGLHSAPAILGLVGRHPVARWLGVLGLLIPLVVYMYYVVIEAWCLHYVWRYLTGAMELGATTAERSAASVALFADISGTRADRSILDIGSTGAGLSSLAIVFALNLWLVHRGLSRGIEAFCRWAMPAMALCAMLVLLRVLTLGTPDSAAPERTVLAGLGTMWNPDPSRLADFETWLAAAGQVFFSLSVGFGVILNYASYLRRDDDVVLSSLTSTATNEVFEVGFGGMITIPAAFVFLGSSAMLGSAFGLGFQTLPVVFASMGPTGAVVGLVWFFMLLLAAITSSISMLQPIKAFAKESLGLSSGRAVAVIGLLTGVGALWVFVHSADQRAMDTMDFWVGTMGILILAGTQIVCFGWVMGAEQGLREASVGARIRIPRWFRVVIRWIAPAYLLIVFVGFCVQTLGRSVDTLGQHPVALHTLALVGVVLVLLLVATEIGARRWKAEDPR